MSELNRPNEQAGLAQWLTYVESLHSQTIDMGLERVRLVAQRLNINFSAVSFVVAGTNGKGSTCAFIEAILLAAGYRVGVYSSPHLLQFNERARLLGVPASDDELLPFFHEVEQARGDVSLSYFEFTMLVIFRLFMESKLDAVILEVGLGGRLDSVNIIDADCSLVTNIALDHLEYLGHTRDAIAYEKAHIYRSGHPAICADPEVPGSLIEHAHNIGADLRCVGRDFSFSGDKQQWSFRGKSQRRHALPYPALRGANQLLNAAGALAALEAVNDRLTITQQSVRQGLLQVALPGRFQVLPGQPTTILDVAHNPHAAAVLAENLDNMGFFPYTHAVFGMMADKAINEVVQLLKPKVDFWYCADLDHERGAKADHILQVLAQEGVQNTKDSGVSKHNSLAQAYACARANASENDRILVFGSFVTVAEVMACLNTNKV